MTTMTWIMMAIAVAYVFFNTGLIMGVLALRFTGQDVIHPKDWSRWSLVGIGWVVWCLLVGLEHVWCDEFTGDDRGAAVGMAAIAIVILWGFGAFAVVVGGPVWSFAPMLVAAFVLAAFVISTLGVWVWRWFCGMVSKAEAVAIMRSAGADDELAGGLTEVE